MTSSVYIHIPFCNHICSYCNFPKFFYNKEIVLKYLKSLKQEILNKYQGEILKTLYIGGGTPSSLDIEELQELFAILKIFKFNKNYEFTIEVNPENLTFEKLKLFFENGVNRISMGVESSKNKNLEYLGRHHDFNLVKKKIKMIKKIGINNINVDLIYALKKQSLEDLKNDLINFLSLDVSHISTYSLEIYPHTILGIKKEQAILEDLDFCMYDLIRKTLTKNGYLHYEISNFAKKGYEAKHNLVYWNNDYYYGFGLGAAGYLNNIRYNNTTSLKNYLNGNYLETEERLSQNDILSYALILGFRKIAGLNKKDFFKKYQVNIKDLYNVKDLLKQGLLKENNTNIYISYDRIYVENSILINFVGE